MKDDLDYGDYADFVVNDDETINPVIPSYVRLVDSKKWVKVDFDNFPIESDSVDRTNVSFRNKTGALSPALAKIFFYVCIDAFNGNRKVSTVVGWISDVDLFTRTIKSIVGKQISTITLQMFIKYCSETGVSSERALRSVLKYWMSKDVPGIESDLKEYLMRTRSPKNRGTIEIQNTTPKERPLTIPQVQTILSRIDDLYIRNEFTTQDYLMWRLLVSEAMRPAQMRLLQIGDVSPQYDENNALVSVEINVPFIKQKATPAREYMKPYTLSEQVGRAMINHLNYLESNHPNLPKTVPIFCLNAKTLQIKGGYISISQRILRSRTKVARGIADFDDIDLFSRRFKHTKLTHLAMAGAPLEVLARAGFQATTVSLKHYVNLSDEAFLSYEETYKQNLQNIADAFSGQIINRRIASNPDMDHRILDTNLDKDLGSCSTKPCNVLAPFGCYLCPRFEAFEDGAHEAVLKEAMVKKERAIRMSLPSETIARDDNILRAIQGVIIQIKAKGTENA